MAAVFLAARTLPSPSTAQGSRAGEQPTRTSPGRVLSLTSPVLLPSSGQGHQLMPSAARPRRGSARLPGAGLALICSWMGFKELIRNLVGFFLPCFQGEILPRICSWLCLDQSHWDGQPHTAAPQSLWERGGVC